MKSVPYSFCCACGTAYANMVWPRHCEACGYDVYKNAVTVCVGIVPVTRNGAFIGVVAVRRDIEPQKGWLAFPGGFQDIEKWREGVARELLEETGIPVNADKIDHYQTVSRPDGQQNLIFGVTEPIDEQVFLEITADDKGDGECSEVVILDAPCELAFPFHTQFIAEFFGLMRRAEKTWGAGDIRVLAQQALAHEQSCLADGNPVDAGWFAAVSSALMASAKLYPQPVETA